MAKLTKLAVFVRVFLLTLLTAGPATRAAAADAVETQEWQRALQQDTVVAYYRYLSLYPAGEFIDLAVAALVRLGALPPPPVTRQIPTPGRTRPSPPPSGLY